MKIWKTTRRNYLDQELRKISKIYKGLVLDIGGRDRGKFKKPKNRVEKWIFADIEKQHNPDIVLDVTNMPKIADNSIDTINATELFEHIDNPEKGISEVHRVLKPNGYAIISTPFLYPIHADPYDFQRWTKSKWKKELKENGLEIKKEVVMGRFFSHASDMILSLSKSYGSITKYLFLPLLVISKLIAKLDNLKIIKENKVLGKYHGGYLIIAQKPE